MQACVTQHRYSFRKSHRVRAPREFAAVFDAKVKIARGPLVIYALPNQLGFSRLGFSVSRRVGTAPRRNRIKRLLRETFRLMQHERSRDLDLIVIVRPHAPLALVEYQTLLSWAVAKLDDAWTQRNAQEKDRLS